MVVGAAREIVREAEHVGDFFREVVGVFVAVAVAEIFHKASGGIAHMERHGIGLGFVDVVEDFAVGDRKSTRLNSSHGSISYAVFCLKKKTSEVAPPLRSTA